VLVVAVAVVMAVRRRGGLLGGVRRRGVLRGRGSMLRRCEVRRLNVRGRANVHRRRVLRRRSGEVRRRRVHGRRLGVAGRLGEVRGLRNVRRPPDVVGDPRRSRRSVLHHGGRTGSAGRRRLGEARRVGLGVALGERLTGLRRAPERRGRV
jgi:hypothetical protein